MTEAVVLVADTHTNSLMGLAPPKVQRDDGSPVGVSKVRRWLSHTWERSWADVHEYIKDSEHKTLIINGDAAELDAKGRTTRIISRNPATILRMCIDLWEPVVSEFDDLFVIRGTEAHTGNAGWVEEALADDLGAIKDTDTDMSSWWHLRGMFGGVKFDVAHHAPMGSLPWTYATAPARYAAQVMWEYEIEWGEKAPDVVVRAHNHRFAESGRTYPARVFSLPCWQFPTAFVHRLGKANARPHIGSLAFLCENKKYQWEDFRYQPRRSKAWERK